MTDASQLSEDDKAFKIEFDTLSKDFVQVHAALDKALRGYPLTGSMGDYILTEEHERNGKHYRTVRHPLAELQTLISDITFDNKNTNVGNIMEKAWEAAAQRAADVAARPDRWDGDNTTIRKAMRNIQVGGAITESRGLQNESTSLRALRCHTLGYALAFLKGKDLALAESVIDRMKAIYGDYVGKEADFYKVNASLVIMDLDKVKTAQAAAKATRARQK